MKKQILVLAAIGVISLSANAYAQSDNSTSPSEPYVSDSEENTDNEKYAKKRESFIETNHNRKNKDEPVPEKPQNRTGHDD